MTLFRKFIITFAIMNPMTASFYVKMIGINLGVDSSEKYRKIKNLKTLKFLNNDAHNIKFINNLLHAESLGFVLNPIVIPFCCYYVMESIYYGYTYLLYYKSRVDAGEYDEDD
jgi:hypothetical protein